MTWSPSGTMRTLRGKKGTRVKLGVQRGNRRLGIPLGISIGKTKAVALLDAASDYLASVDALRDYADYLAVNISSPNTPGLRTLQHASQLEQLLACIIESASQGPDPLPVFVKLAPDLEPGTWAETLAVIRDSGAAGIIATNTTLSREGLAAGDQHGKMNWFCKPSLRMLIEPRITIFGLEVVIQTAAAKVMQKNLA